MLKLSTTASVQDGFHLFELQGGTSIKFILIIIVALIGLAVKLGIRKRKLASIGQLYTKPTVGMYI